MSPPRRYGAGGAGGAGSLWQRAAGGRWRALAGQFIPPIDADSLPGGLLERLTAEALTERLMQLLISISAVTTSTGSLPVCADPQKM